MSRFTYEVQIDKPNNTRKSKENANGIIKKKYTSDNSSILSLLSMPL